MGRVVQLDLAYKTGDVHPVLNALQSDRRHGARPCFPTTRQGRRTFYPRTPDLGP